MASNDEKPAIQHWAIDKKIPLALIFAIVCQTGLGFYWVAKTDARLENLERQFGMTMPYGERIIRLEENVIGIKEGVGEIKSLLRRPPIDVGR